MTSYVFAFFFFVQFFSCFFNPLLTFSLKNCTIWSLDKIVEVMCQKRCLKEVPDDIPPYSTILDLRFNNILEIKATDLKDLSKLISLLLNDNHIYRIEDGSFTDLKELKMLRISYNKVRNLTDNMFVGLTNLTSLFLNTNHISQISSKAFEPLVSLHTVFLDENHIGRIRDFAKLFQLPHIELISFNNNNITFFDSDDLPFNTTNVSSLFFGHTYVKKFSLKRDIFPHLQSFQFQNRQKFDWDVPNKTFLRSVTTMSFGRPNKVNLDTFVAMLRSTSSLKVLNLDFPDSNSIKSLVLVACSIPSMTKLTVSLSTLGTIDDDLLRPCSNVTELMLPINSLKKLSDQSLKSLSKLRLLDLDSNNLHQVPSTIRHLSVLESLDLSNNYIGEISCLDFANLTKLRTLNLRKNRIANMDECVFQNLYNLNSLDVGENVVRSFRNAFRVNMSKLEILKFDHNVFRFIFQQGEFRNLSSLRFLNLESTKYSFSQDGVFEGLNRLQNLIFSAAQFTKGFFEGLLELKYLLLYVHRPITKMSISQLGNSDPPFSGLINLQQLSLIVYTKVIMNITPDFFNGLKSLEYLKVDNFFQTSIHPDTFRYTPQLQNLEIVNSGLSVLAPEVFYPIPKLLKLNLSNNKFGTLNFLANLKALRLLKATDNHLTVINDTIFQTLPNLTYLDLTNNPLICDCLNAGFQQWVLSNNQTQVINGHQYKCVMPDTQQTHNFLDLDTRSCLIDFGFIFFISSCCLIVLTLSVSFVYSFLRWQLAYAYYLFLAYVYDTRSKKKGTGHLYDAFISYNVHDEDWVYSEMLPVLEGQQGWRLCLHHRDFEPGKPIVENITDAIYGSRKTICVISQHYLQSEWCSREIQMASVRLFDEQKDVLILVFLEDIPTWRLSPYYQIRRLVKKHTYLSWPQAAQHKGVFWQKLNQALKTGKAPNDNKHLIVEPER